MYRCVVTFPNGASRRSAPSTFSPVQYVYRQDDVFTGISLSTDVDDPNNTEKLWMRDAAGGFVAVRYPSSRGYSQRVEFEIMVTESNVVQGLHDDQTHWKSREGLPETYPFFLSVFIPLNKAWQFFWFEQFKICSPQRAGENTNQWIARLKKSYANTIKNGVCFTDYHAVQQGYADYINGVNPDAGGICHKTIWTGGNIMSVTGGITSKGGESHYPIAYLNARNFPPDPAKVNMFTRPDLIHKATVRTKIVLPDGRHRVDPFPQNGGDPVPYMVISKDPQFVNAKFVRFVGKDEVTSPYVP